MDQKFFRTLTTITTRGRKRIYPGSISPRKVWKPQPHWFIYGWQALLEPARVEIFPPGQRRRPAAPGDDKVPSPRCFRTSTTNSNNPGTNTDAPQVDTVPQGVEIPTPLADFLAGAHHGHGANARRDFPLGATSRSHRTRGRQNSIPGPYILPYVYIFNNPGTKTEIPRVDTVPQGVETPIPPADFRFDGGSWSMSRRTWA